MESYARGLCTPKPVCLEPVPPIRVTLQQVSASRRQLGNGWKRDNLKITDAVLYNRYVWGKAWMVTRQKVRTRVYQVRMVRRGGIKYLVLYRGYWRWLREVARQLRGEGLVFGFRMIRNCLFRKGEAANDRMSPKGDRFVSKKQSLTAETLSKKISKYRLSLSSGEARASSGANVTGI